MGSKSAAMVSSLAWSCQCSARPPTRPGVQRRAGEARYRRASAPVVAASLSTSTSGISGSGLGVGHGREEGL
eukprot:124983-Lingulodinium_polyedra.AAC.1